MKLILSYCLIFTVSLIAENQKTNQKQMHQQERPMQQVHKQVSTLVKKISPQNKQKKSSEQAQVKKPVENVQTLITNFTKAIQEIPEKKVDHQNQKNGNSKQVKNGEKDANLINNKEYKEALEKAYKAYQAVYKEKDNKSLTESQKKQVKQDAIQLFKLKNIKNMVWPYFKNMKDPDKRQTDKK